MYVLSSTLPGPNVSEVTTLCLYKYVYYYVIIITIKRSYNGLGLVLGLMRGVGLHFYMIVLFLSLHILSVKVIL